MIKPMALRLCGLASPYRPSPSGIPPHANRNAQNGWTFPQILRRYGSARSARARRSYDRVMEDAP
jgi:hypothetical protein